MRVIIRCAGGARRWADYLGVPKHQAPICGEPILHRAVRLVNEIAPTADVKVVVPDLQDKRYKVPGSSRATDKPTPENGDVDKIASSLHLWDRDRTVIIFGDVWWTRDDVTSILTDPVADGWGAWLRIVGDGGEIFGFAFEDYMRDEVAAACGVVAEAHRAGDMRGVPGGWALYRVMHGKAIDDHGDHGHSHPVSDWTADMDTARDWDEWCYRWATTPEEMREVVIR